MHLIRIILFELQQLIKLSRQVSPMHTIDRILGPQYFGTSKKKSCLDDADKSIPGPGAHSPQKYSQITPPQWKIGESTNRHSFLDPHRAKIPSPQQYKVSHAPVEKLSKKMSIPQSTYEPKPNSLNPKSCYEANPNFTKTAYPEFSFGYSMQPNYSTLAPGPGTYDPLPQKPAFNKTQSGFSIGLRPAPYGQEAKFPAPDKYHTINHSESPKFSFGKACRSQNKIGDSPGRFYDLQPKKTTIKLGRGKSTEYKRQPTFLTVIESPGPSAYQSDLNPKILHGVMETSKRIPIENLGVAEFPSPDKYMVHKEMEMTKAQSFIKDARHLEAINHNSPGPGVYYPMPVLSKIGGAISKKQETTNEEKEVFPGAATYYPKDTITRKKVNSTLVLRSNRIDFTKTFSGAIGPGEYNIFGHLQRELGKMSKSPRAGLNSPDKNPGVGNYNIPSLIGQLPKYCTSPKKMTENGYSTFHEKLKLRMLQKQSILNAAKIQKQVSEQETNYNPEEVRAEGNELNV